MAQVIQPPAKFSRPTEIIPPSGSSMILMIGDSLSVEGFGPALNNVLVAHYGRSRFAMFASCGSSPEHWLRSGPTYYTHCGFRESTPQEGDRLWDFENGRAPAPHLTPKLEDLLATYRPSVVVVQLGTNWMDPLEGRRSSDESHYASILDQLVSVVNGPPYTVHQMFWITPPDSSHYTRAVQNTVFHLIQSASVRHNFQIIDSRTMTHYVRGRSGGDGIHYGGADARAWAAGVEEKLLEKIR